MTNPEDWRNLRFVVVDIEGNGRQPPDIVEISVAVLESGEISGAPRVWLIRPALGISHIVSRLHGITNEMVANAPAFADIATEICGILRDDYLVAHNAKVELDILKPRLADWSPRGVVDTLRLARQFLPGRKSYSLTALTDDLGLHDSLRGESQRRHRADYDVLVTAHLFMRLAIDQDGTPRPLSTLLGENRPARNDVSPQRSLF
jgi:DNA polymerase III epsilon subunit-like protein